MIKLEPKYSIGQEVWSSVGDHQRGIVIDWMYSYRERVITYQVTFGADNASLYYYEEELSESPIYHN